MVMYDVVFAKETVTNYLTVKTYTNFSGSTILMNNVTLSRPSQITHYNANSGKAGASAGFVTANDKGMVTLPAAQALSTWTIPLNLKQGSIIGAFSISGQIDSTGATVTLDADLRVLTAAEAGSTDASIGAITQISKTADYKVADSKTGLSHTVIAGNQYYLLIAGSTGATSDIELLTVEVSVTEK